jgi:transcriptional regulator GlxA family with amidase domain
MLAAVDLCLHILREDHGHAYANDVARLLVSPPFRIGGQAQYRSNGHRPARGTMAELMTWIDGHLDETITLSRLAAQAGTSTRTIVRRFDVETGRGALQWVNERRVATARGLLEDTDRSVTDISFATGFGSLGAFRRQFTRLTGTTPSQYRRTFRPPPHTADRMVLDGGAHVVLDGAMHGRR